MCFLSIDVIFFFCQISSDIPCAVEYVKITFDSSCTKAGLFVFL